MVKGHMAAGGSWYTVMTWTWKLALPCPANPAKPNLPPSLLISLLTCAAWCALVLILGSSSRRTTAGPLCVPPALDGQRRCQQVGVGGRRGAQLVQLVGEEAHAALAVGRVLAQLGAVAAGVQPALKHAVGKGAAVAALAGPLQGGREGRGPQ
jgi:hypothetical protein